MTTTITTESILFRDVNQVPLRTINARDYTSLAVNIIGDLVFVPEYGSVGQYRFVLLTVSDRFVVCEL